MSEESTAEKIHAEPITDPGHENATGAETDRVSDDIETEPDEPGIVKARKEAAKYRERLRTAESERDAASDTIEVLRRQIVDAHIEKAGLKPEAVWAAGHTTADLLSADGTIDESAIIEAVKNTRERLGIGRFGGAADQGARTSGATVELPKWSDLLSQQN